MSKPWISSEEYKGECRRTNNNGSQKLVWTLAMSSCGVIFVMGMAWWGSLNMRMTVAEATLASRGERIALLEGAVVSINARLPRIEDKLDRMIAETRKVMR